MYSIERRAPLLKKKKEAARERELFAFFGGRRNGKGASEQMDNFLDLHLGGGGGFGYT